MKSRWLRALPILSLGPLGLIPISEDASRTPRTAPPGPRLDLSSFAPSPPGRELDLLFIHHSCGGQLLAPAGPDAGEACLYRSHPNGGGLRAMLERQGYRVHEASYGSVVGEETDLFDWLPKFRDRMDLVLATAHQDSRLPAGRTNRIVVFKSCFPNNAFVGEGQPPGDPRGGRLSYWNARAAMTALLPLLARRPDVLFVYVTAPPLAPRRREPAVKWLARKVGLLPARAPLAAGAALARRFNDWIASPSGWLAGYAGRNIVVFDYFDVLTGGTADVLAYPTGGGYDSHPAAAGNRRAAAAFVPFLNRAARRWGLASEPSPVATGGGK